MRLYGCTMVSFSCTCAGRLTVIGGGTRRASRRRSKARRTALRWVAAHSKGGAIASPPEDRVRHLEIEQYGINDVTADVAAEAAVAHLRG